MLPLYPPKPTGSERGNLQEANLLQKIRIYNGSLRGTKPVARTATGLHEKYLEISQKKPNQCPILSTKKKKGKENILCSKRIQKKVHQYLHLSLLFLLKNKSNPKRLKVKHGLKQVVCVGRPQTE